MAPQLKYPPVFLALALLLGLFTFFPAPASAAAAQPWQWNSLPTGTAVAISSPSTTTGTLLAQGNTSAATRGAASNASNAPAGVSPGPSFDSLRLDLNANPPGQCAVPLYGTITARAPDGALCLCHQSYDGKQSIWEQIGTGRPCWPDQK
jgi:hypothetical protein